MGWGGDCNVWKTDGCNSKCFLHVYSDRMCVLKVPYAKMYFSGSPNLLLGSSRNEPQTCLPSNMPPNPKCHPNGFNLCLCLRMCVFFLLAHGLVGAVLLGNFHACAIYTAGTWLAAGGRVASANTSGERLVPSVTVLATQSSSSKLAA